MLKRWVGTILFMVAMSAGYALAAPGDGADLKATPETGTAVAAAGENKIAEPITDKTLIAWGSLADLDQRGGSLLTIEDPGDREFDGVVFGEIHPQHWEFGSHFHLRSRSEITGQWAPETSDPGTLVQLVAVYRGTRLSLWRNGELLGECEMKNPPKVFGPEACVVIGPRHRIASDRRVLRGAVQEARIYDTALTPEQIAALRPGEISDPPPLAWWDFASGSDRDRMGTFPQTVLTGGAKIDGGRLLLDGKRSAFQAFRADADAAALSREVIDHLDQRPPGAVGDGDFVNNIPALNKSQRVLRDMMLRDPHRPVYHLIAPESVCAPYDPNGAIYWNGRYHLFYIFQDERGHCWGHVSSTDLLHWRWHTPDLAPSDGGPDVIMFSGAALPTTTPGTAAIIWPGGCGQCLMTSSDRNLDYWEKSPLNPVAPPPSGPAYYAMGDPHAWLEGDTYYILGGGQRCVPSLLKTNDLNRRFTYVGDFMKHDLPEVEPWEDTSCPDFFRLRDKHVFMCLSHDKGVRYYIGRWENEQFVPEKVYRLNYPGGSYYASESLEGPDGRRIFWGWLDDLPYGKYDFWSGIMSLPRVLDLEPDGLTPIVTPAAELERLRYNPVRFDKIHLAAGETLPLPELRGDAMEFRLRIRSDDEQASFGLRVRCSDDGREETPIFVDQATRTIRIGLKKASLENPEYRTYVVDVFHPGGPEANTPVDEQIAPLDFRTGETVELRIFLDRSVLEVFVNDRICMSQLIWPTLPDSLGVSLFSEGGAAEVESLEAWEMSPTMAW